MTKAELIDKIAADTGLTKVASGEALEAVLSSITNALKEGDKVKLVGFGTFSVAKRAARKGRNPYTGETIKIKPRKAAHFKASKELSAQLL